MQLFKSVPVHAPNQTEGDRLQADAEMQTNSFTPTKRQFVPWIAINNRSLIEMQAYQMNARRKVCHLVGQHSTIVTNVLDHHQLVDYHPTSGATIQSLRPNVPTHSYALAYYDRTFWLPINLTIIYDVNDRQLITNSLIDQFRRRLWSNDAKMHRMVRFRWIAQCAGQSSCYSMRIHECVQRIIDDQRMMSDYVVCHAQTDAHHR